MSAIDAVECPHCAARIRIKSESILGKKVTCPKCSEPFVAKSPAARSKPLEMPAVKIGDDAATSFAEMVAVACPHCEAKFRMKSATLGKSRTCPKCSEEFTPKVSKPAAAKARSNKSVPVIATVDEDDDFMKSLSAAAKDSRWEDQRCDKKHDGLCDHGSGS